jgi:hypothetical protein
MSKQIRGYIWLKGKMHGYVMSSGRDSSGGGTYHDADMTLL